MNMKEELIKRYCYLCENVEYILAPYIKVSNFNEVRKDKNQRKFRKNFDITVADLERLPYNLLIDLESFLLSDIPCEESEFYLKLESNKKDTEYLNKVKDGLTLLKETNDKILSPLLKTKINIWKLLSKVRNFIDSQHADRYTRVDKLHAMDEYFKIARYANDGKVWRSGYDITFSDYKNTGGNVGYIAYSDPSYPREKDDEGIDAGKFIYYLTNAFNHNKENDSILTEEEKQTIYLKYHDELPWNKTRVCDDEEEYIIDSKNSKLVRPRHTNPCGNTFYVKEEEIFMDPDDSIHPYYQLCPHCGYIVNIGEESLSKGVRKRIQNRCIKDPNLFRKMYLYSELFALEKETPNSEKKLLRTKKSNQ